MREIGKVEYTEKKRQRNSTYIAIFMLLTLVFSTVGFAFFYNDSSKTSNNPNNLENSSAPLVIQQQGDRWAVPFRGQYLSFVYSPNSTSNIDVQIDKDAVSYYGSNLFIDSKKDYVTSEITSTLGKYVLSTSKACYGSCIENIPEKNCTDNIIVFNESNVQKIKQKDNCIFIDGDLRTVDAVLYKIFGISDVN